MQANLVLVLVSTLAPAQAPPSYAKHVQPFFTRYCVECHNAGDAEGGLSLESYKSLLAGGKHGAAVEAGKPDTSRLVRMIEGKGKPVMPPKRAKQPDKDDVALVRAWVLAGARDDSAGGRVTLPSIVAKRKVGTPVAAVAYSPDGKTLAAAGRGEVLLLDALTGQLRSRIPAGRDRVTALAYSSTGTLAVAAGTAGEGHEVRLITDGKPTVATRHDDLIQNLAFSPDGKLLATAGYDRLIKLWDVAAGKERLVLRDHSDSVYGLSFSPDGKLLASGGADRAVKVWDVATGTRLYTLGESTDWVYAVAWSPTGNRLAAAGVDRSIRVWEADAKGGRIVQSAFGHEGPINRLVYSRDGKRLWSLCEDGGAKLWDAATLSEKLVYPRQPETALSLAVQEETNEIAIGRFDGALVVLAAATGKTVREPLPIKIKPPVAVIEAMTPSAFVRGQTVDFTLTGNHVADAQVVSDLPGIVVHYLATPLLRRRCRATIPPTTAPGAYTLRLKNDGGESKPHTFFVDRYPATAEKEPNDSPRTGQRVHLPVTVTGTLDREGDLDWYTFGAKANVEVGVELLAVGGAKFAPLLRLVDPDGNTVAETTTGLLGHTCVKEGVYALGVREREYRGGGNRAYRLSIGDVPVVTSIFPLGLQQGTTATVTLQGVNLGPTRTVKVTAPETAALGSRIPVPVPAGTLGGPALVVGAFPELTIGLVKSPATVNGVIATPGQAQTWRFEAKKGERLILDVAASRIGSQLDSTLEILDGVGRPLPRATLRASARTFVVFRDHDSRAPGIRIETWGELAVNDYLLVGNELLRIWALPRNPDDDCQFFAEKGQRLGYLGTTPTFVSNGLPMYKVAVHPPGTTFPSNGLPVTTLFWRNDDGGPGFGKDSRLVFDPPADGVYQLRVGDARGEGSNAHGYRLTVRPPKPDYSVSFRLAGTVSKGGAIPVTVDVDRIDEFAGAIELKLTGLPAGFHAPVTNVPAGENGTVVSLYADAAAVAPKEPVKLELEATATIDGKKVVRKASGTLPKLTEPGEIVTTTEEVEVTLRPGGEATVTVKVERRNGFAGRIPVEVQGLPHGVRVLDVGLNGILVTPAETRRTFVLYCEPWVETMSHPIVVLAKSERKGTDHAAKSVLLKVAK